LDSRPSRPRIQSMLLATVYPGNPPLQAAEGLTASPLLNTTAKLHHASNHIERAVVLPPPAPVSINLVLWPGSSRNILHRPISYHPTSTFDDVLSRGFQTTRDDLDNVYLVPPPRESQFLLLDPLCFIGPVLHAEDSSILQALLAESLSSSPIPFKQQI
jgi:hypothetical protein